MKSVAVSALADKVPAAGTDPEGHALRVLAGLEAIANGTMPLPPSPQIRGLLLRWSHRATERAFGLKVADALSLRCLTLRDQLRRDEEKLHRAARTTPAEELRDIRQQARAIARLADNELARRRSIRHAQRGVAA